ncbi:hypothetical protein ACVIJ1_005804 [Bradyrhizobium elkanii]
MKVILALAFAAATLTMPVIASAQVTRQACLDYCEGERGKMTEAWRFKSC